MKKILDFFLFSSLFISLVAMVMVNETNHLLNLKYNRATYLLFVLFSTICSYNLHWLFTAPSSPEKIRASWTHKHRWLNIALIIIGLFGSAYFALQLIQYWLWLAIAVTLTFLYTAPKLPLPFASFLQKIAIGKTLFLTAVWTYVTTVLPILIAEQTFSYSLLLFAVYRFLYIYAICIIFDYRDREQDRQEGIRSMITRFSDSGVNRLFYFTIIAAVVAVMILYFTSFTLTICILLMLPIVASSILYSYAKKNRSDYFYYFILDGLMMASALFTPFLAI